MSTVLMQKVAQVAPEKYNFFLKTAAEVRESPFRDEIVSELNHIIKRANQGFMQGPWGTAGKAIGTAVGTSIAVSLAGDMFDSLKRGITKGRNYRAMMKANPDLAEHDAKEVQTAFSTLHRFNPEFSGDPSVAGTLVKHQLKMDGGPNLQSLTSMIGARKHIHDVKRLPNPLRMDEYFASKKDKQGPAQNP